MSIWQSIEGERYIKSIDTEAFRLIEGQHYIATRKLVDSLIEHEILEDLIDRSKPSAPLSNTKGALHYLLYTPFRYPPLQSGSRFGTSGQQSIFYASANIETAMAEIAFRHFLHYYSSDSNIRPAEVDFSHIKVRVKTNKAVDLTSHPFNIYREQISDPDSHGKSQILGSEMRNAGIEAFTYFSARYEEGINIGLFSPEAFASNKPLEQKGWKVFLSRERIEFKSSFNHKVNYEYNLSDFMQSFRLYEVA